MDAFDAADMVLSDKENADLGSSLKSNRRFSVRIMKKSSSKALALDEVKNIAPSADEMVIDVASAATAAAPPVAASPRSMKRSESLTRKLSNLAGSLKGSLKKKLGVHLASLLDSKPSKIFGQPLDEVVEKEKAACVARDGVPSVVTRCISYLIPKHAAEEGLFRISGASTEIQSLKETIDKGEPTDIENEDNAHNVSGLLKLFVRELPAPLIPQDKQEAFIVIAEVETKEMQREALYSRISQLPLANLRLLRRLFAMMAQVAERVNENKMSPSNLATVWGPNLFWNDKEKLETNPHKILEWSRQVNAIVQIMIEEQQTIFREREFEKLYTLGNLEPLDSPASRKRSREDFQGSQGSGRSVGRRNIRSEMISSFDAVLQEGSIPEESEDEDPDMTEPNRKRRKGGSTVSEVVQSIKDSPKALAQFGKKLSRRLSERPSKSSSPKATCSFLYFDMSKQSEALRKVLSGENIIPAETRSDGMDPISFTELKKLLADCGVEKVLAVIKRGDSQAYTETKTLAQLQDDQALQKFIYSDSTNRLRAPSMILGKNLVVGFEKDVAEYFKKYLIYKLN